MKKLIIIFISIFCLSGSNALAYCNYYSAWPQNNDCLNGCCRCNCICDRDNVSTGRTLQITNNSLYKKLKGQIIVRTEGFGEAYFVDNEKPVIYYLPDYKYAYDFLMDRGVSMSANDLSRISLGLLPVTEDDNDRDGLSDRLEIAVGTDRLNFNSDQDRYSDKVELANGYNPNGPGKLKLNQIFASQQKGRVLFQQGLWGDAWYVNPHDGKRYFFSNPIEVLNLIKLQGLGVSEENFYKLAK